MYNIGHISVSFSYGGIYHFVHCIGIVLYLTRAATEVATSSHACPLALLVWPPGLKIGRVTLYNYAFGVFPRPQDA